MSWIIKENSLFAKSGNEIGYFLPTASESERAMIKNGDELIDIVGEFVTGYDERKISLKSIVDRLSKIVRINADYKNKWMKTLEGELLNANDQLIFFFVNPNSIFARVITLLPEVYSCSQDLLQDMNSTTKRHEIKKIYNRICVFFDKTNED